MNDPGGDIFGQFGYCLRMPRLEVLQDILVAQFEP